MIEADPDGELMALQSKLAGLGCAEFYDAASRYVHVVRCGLRPMHPGARLAAPVFPVTTANDMLPCLQALEEAPPGWAILLSNEAPESEALAGEIVVTAAKAQGLAGLVVNGAVRDVDSYAEIGLPVFAREITFVSAKTARVPAANLPTSVTLPPGIVVHPGDWLIANGDGVLHIPAGHLRAVAASALLLYRKEQAFRERLDRGERFATLTGLRAFLDGSGPLRFNA